jgi:hypothetical protein
MIAVIAAVGGEIERDREAHLAAGEIAPVEGIGVLGGREARILAHRPGTGRIHGRIGTTQIRRDAGIGVEKIEPGRVIRTIGRLDRDTFRGEPRLSGSAGRRDRRVGEGDGAEIGDSRHGSLAQ